MKSRLVPAALALPVVAAILAAGCGHRPAQNGDGTPTATIERPDSAPARPSARATVVFLGTSLTAGLGVDPDQAYPALLQRKADSAGLALTILNRGNSGETSAGALARVGWILQTPPSLLVIETGANDGLRGQDPDSTKANIQAIIDKARARDSTIRIAIVGMEAMPNLGRRYVERFRAIYPELARRNDAIYVPVLLEGIAGVEGLNQADGVHPTPKGQERVAENVWKALRPTFEELGRGK